MIEHEVRTYPSAAGLARPDQLAWKLAAVATDPVDVPADVTEMVINRVIDDAAVAAASLAREPVRAAREQSLRHPSSPGAAVWGAEPQVRISPEWAAWANGVAVRELDFHDTFLAADYSHPGDNILPLLAVAQHTGRTGGELVRAIATGYEVQVDLVKGICLHEHRIDHIAHLGPSVAAGLGTLLGLDTDVVYQAIGQALHCTTQTRQSRKGEISSWKAYAPAFAGKTAIEAVDRAMRGQGSPSPIYEGEDGVIAWLLSGPEAVYTVPLPAPGEPKRAILETYTKEHSAEYQAQALIDLARRLHPRYPDTSEHRQDRDPHQPSHPLRDRLRVRRPAEVRPRRQPGDPGPLAAVHLRGRPAGRRLASRPLLRARARQQAGHGRAVAQDQHGRGPRVDPALPRSRPGQAGVRRPGGDHLDRRHHEHGRDRGGGRSSRGRAPVRPRAVRGQVPHPGRGPDRPGRPGPVPRPGVAAAGAGLRPSWPAWPCPASPRPASRRPPGGSSDAARHHPRGGQAGRVPGRAGVRDAAAVPRSVQPAVRYRSSPGTTSTACTSPARWSPPSSGCRTSG